MSVLFGAKVLANTVTARGYGNSAVVSYGQPTEKG